MEQNPTKKSWPRRHPILTGFGVFILIIIASSGSDTKTAPTTSAPQPEAQAIAPTDSVTTASVVKKENKTANSQQPTTPSVPSTPAPQAPAVVAPTQTWHEAYTYKNSTDIKTPPFNLQGSKWKITYSCETDPDAKQYDINAQFYGYIYSTATGRMAANFASFVDCPKTDTTYVYAQNPGEYYLDLAASNGSYKVTVEDYY